MCDQPIKCFNFFVSHLPPDLTGVISNKVWILSEDELHQCCCQVIHSIFIQKSPFIKEVRCHVGVYLKSEPWVGFMGNATVVWHPIFLMSPLTTQLLCITTSCGVCILLNGNGDHQCYMHAAWGMGEQHLGVLGEILDWWTMMWAGSGPPRMGDPTHVQAKVKVLAGPLGLVLWIAPLNFSTHLILVASVAEFDPSRFLRKWSICKGSCKLQEIRKGL